MNYCPLDFRLIFWSHMNFEMIDKIFLIFLSPVALVALIIRSIMNYSTTQFHALI